MFFPMQLTCSVLYIGMFLIPVCFLCALMPCVLFCTLYCASWTAAASLLVNMYDTAVVVNTFRRWVLHGWCLSESSCIHLNSLVLLVLRGLSRNSVYRNPDCSILPAWYGTWP